MPVFTYHVIAVLVVALWAVCVYAIVRRDERVHLNRAFIVPLPVLTFIAVVALLFILLLPAPWGVSAAIAVAGFGLAAWSDRNTGYLWDDAIISTTLICAGVMALGGRPEASITGGVVCGIVASVYYFCALSCGRQAGYGDVKLVAGIGFVLGPIGGLAAYLMGVVLVAVGAFLFAHYTKKNVRELWTKPLPFGLAFTGGMIISAALLPYINAVR